jgi:ribosome-interacting GTPase 1
LGLLKAKLAKLKREIIEGSCKKGAAGEGFDVQKSGDSRIGMVGFPSVGKSTLLTKLTGNFPNKLFFYFRNFQ